MNEAPIEFIDTVAGLYFRSILLLKAGDVAEQHQHDHDHATLCGSGSVALYLDGEHEGDYLAGHAIYVQAGRRHKFKALEDNTRLTCVHDVASADSIRQKGL